MAAPDDKQNRLSTLSQDVIAVPKKPAAPAAPRRPAEAPVADSRPVPPPPPPPAPAPAPAARAPERKDIPAAQDVFRVSTASQPVLGMPGSQPAVRRSPPPAPAPAMPVARLAQAAVAVAAVALLLAGYAAFTGGGDAEAAAANDQVVARLEAELKAANERVAKLEAKMSSASADAQKLGAPGTVNVLQLSASMRELRDDLDMVTNQVDRLEAQTATQVGELRTLAGAGSKEAKMALAQVEQVGARVATLNQQMSGLPKGGAGAPAGDVQAQLKQLSQKTEKMAADIRQLYRQAGGQ